MRNFTLISLLIALAIGGILWQKTLVNNAPDHLLDSVDYKTTLEKLDDVKDSPDNCDESNQESPGCAPEVKSAEQTEMENQNSRAYGTMMKSFDDKLDKYKKQIGGRP
ncbi:hypothetical protein BMS3Bbin11_00814 [bacterium BMS3Bbin11]|nr:hypothetical protein BMS3Abin11_00749 [bacterium BMS3Abin11]GBE45722.1 hypothetical protein BMS3Bbin11_00814 [bacterium BMS3Bbin11]GMT39450.1 MAG: hypothetical protein IEMM0001_0185 [bacterium]HDH09038.1 hypothetical protein [Gammaproteobacteria bacterium]HDH16809.1 hypothetical protein [Gammaproteobacteria bacterium]